MPKKSKKSKKTMGRGVRVFTPQDWKMGLAIASKLGSVNLKVKKTKSRKGKVQCGGPDGCSRGVASVSSTEPVNPGLSTTTAPSFSVSKSSRYKDAIVINGQERLGEISVTSGATPGTQLISFDINPRNIGTRLPQFAALYRKYIFRVVNFRYVPNATAFTSGANTELMMAIDYDPTSSDIIPTDVLIPDELYSWEGTMAGSAIGAIQTSLRRYDPNSEYYIEDDGGENRLVTQARFYLINSTTPTATSELGVLYCNYSVELFIPHTPGLGAPAPPPPSSLVEMYYETTVHARVRTDAIGGDVFSPSSWLSMGPSSDKTIVVDNPNFIVYHDTPSDKFRIVVAPGGYWFVTLSYSFQHESLAVADNLFAGCGANILDFIDTGHPNNNVGPALAFSNAGISLDITVSPLPGSTYPTSNLAPPSWDPLTTTLIGMCAQTEGHINSGYWAISGHTAVFTLDTLSATTTQVVYVSVVVDDYYKTYLNANPPIRDQVNASLMALNLNSLSMKHKRFVQRPTRLVNPIVQAAKNAKRVQFAERNDEFTLVEDPSVAAPNRCLTKRSVVAMHTPVAKTQP